MSYTRFNKRYSCLKIYDKRPITRKSILVILGNVFGNARGPNLNPLQPLGYRRIPTLTFLKTLDSPIRTPLEPSGNCRGPPFETIGGFWIHFNSGAEIV